MIHFLNGDLWPNFIFREKYGLGCGGVKNVPVEERGRGYENILHSKGGSAKNVLVLRHFNPSRAILFYHSLRFSKDDHINDYDLDLLDFCKGSGFITINGKIHSDRGIGNYTCYHHNGGKCLIDYLLTMSTYIEHIENFEIMNKRVENGFKENCGTTDNIFILNALIDRQNAKKQPSLYTFCGFYQSISLQAVAPVTLVTSIEITLG